MFKNATQMPDRGVWTVIVVLSAAAWWSATYNLDLRVAIGGFQPLHYIGQATCPECFAGDFDLGDMASVSLISDAYELGHWLGFDMYTWLLVLIAFETLLIPCIVFWGAKRIFDCERDEALFITALVMLSGALHVNLGGWTSPTFMGHPYATGQAAQTLGILLLIGGRPIMSGLIFAVGFAMHPAMGGLGLAFAVGMVLAYPGLLRSRLVWLGGGLAAALALIWLRVAFSAHDLAAPGGLVSDAEWFAINRMMNYHFFPDERGILSFRADAVLIPWLCVNILALHYMQRLVTPGPRERMLAGGLAMSALLTCVGIAFAVTEASPELVRLVLVRASELAGVIGIFYIGRGFYVDITRGHPFRGLSAGVVLISVFSFPRYPVVPVLLLVATDLLKLRVRQERTFIRYLEVGFIAVVIGLTAYLVGNDILKRPPEWILTGNRPWVYQEWWSLTGAGLVVAVIIFRAACKLRTAIAGQRGNGPDTAHPRKYRIAAFILFIAIGVMGGHHLWVNRSFARSEAVETWAFDYKAIQLWARQSTPPGTIFMPDPTIYYGWRDYSWRPSFGSVMEWIRQPISYHVDEAAYVEGRRRFSEFGIDLEPYKAMGPDMKGLQALSKDIKEAYYAKPREWFIDIGARYGVSYAIFERKSIKNELMLPVAFDNSSFVVYQLAPNQSLE